MALSKNKMRHLRTLHRKKGRREHGTYLLEGDKIVRELLDHSPEAVVQIYATDSWLGIWQARYPELQQKMTAASPQDLLAVSSLTTPNQAVAEAYIPSQDTDFQILEDHFSFYLDGLQDPGNAGTILRVADWFGFPAVVFGPGSVDPWNPKTVQAAMGAVLRVRVMSAAIDQIVHDHPNLAVYGACLDGTSLFEHPFHHPGMVVIGNESQGIRPEVLDLLTHSIRIPPGPAASSGAESLNAGVAAGIFGAFITHRHDR